MLYLVEKTPLANNETLTNQQRKAMHLWFELVANVLSEQGKTMNQVITAPIRPTKENVKEMIFKPVMQATFNKMSTNELCKQKEIDTIVDTIIQTFGEMGITLPNFPSIEEQNFLNTYK